MKQRLTRWLCKYNLLPWHTHYVVGSKGPIDPNWTSIHRLCKRCSG